jgi:hypothetical protein
MFTGQNYEEIARTLVADEWDPQMTFCEVCDETFSSLRSASKAYRDQQKVERHISNILECHGKNSNPQTLH